MLPGDVDVQLPHHRDCLTAHVGRMRSGREDLKGIVSLMPDTPEPKNDADGEDSADELELDEDVLEEDAPQQCQSEFPQVKLVPERAQPGNIELYRRTELVEVQPEDWHMAVLIFREMGWKPVRQLEAYIQPLTFVPQSEGEAIRRAGRSLFALLQEEPADSASVQMDLGLFYRLTEFVGDGAFIVAIQGAYAKAVAEDFGPP